MHLTDAAVVVGDGIRPLDRGCHSAACTVIAWDVCLACSQQPTWLASQSFQTCCLTTEVLRHRAEWNWCGGACEIVVVGRVW